MKFVYIANEHEDPDLTEIKFFGITFERNGPAVDVPSDHVAYQFLLGNGQFKAVKEKVSRKTQVQ